MENQRRDFVLSKEIKKVFSKIKRACNVRPTSTRKHFGSDQH